MTGCCDGTRGGGSDCVRARGRRVGDKRWWEQLEGSSGRAYADVCRSILGCLSVFVLVFVRALHHLLAVNVLDTHDMMPRALYRVGRAKERARRKRRYGAARAGAGRPGRGVVAAVIRFLDPPPVSPVLRKSNFNRFGSARRRRSDGQMSIGSPHKAVRWAAICLHRKSAIRWYPMVCIPESDDGPTRQLCPMKTRRGCPRHPNKAAFPGHMRGSLI